MTASFSSSTDYLPNFGIVYDLLTLEDGTSQLSIVFGSGIFSNERANDYNFSYFHLNPFNNSNDSIFAPGERLKYEFHPNPIWGPETFMNVFYIPNGIYTGFGFVTTDCYNQIGKGVIAFTDINVTFEIIK